MLVRPHVGNKDWFKVSKKGQGKVAFFHHSYLTYIQNMHSESAALKTGIRREEENTDN